MCCLYYSRMESSFHIEKKKLNEFIMIPKQFWKLPEYYNSWTTRIQIAKTFTVLHVSDCNPKWLQTIYLSPSYTQRASGYCTPCDSLRTSARQSDALSHGCRLVKLRHIMWCALNQWKGRILVRGVIKQASRNVETNPRTDSAVVQLITIL